LRLSIINWMKFENKYRFSTSYYSLKDVCKVMKKPCRYVINVLKRNRYYGQRGDYNAVTPGMLEVLADDYINNLRNFFNQAINGEVKNQDKLRNFNYFRVHFKKQIFRSLIYAESWDQIDEDLIRQSFLRQIQEKAPAKNVFSSFSRLVQELCEEVTLEPFLSKPIMVRTVYSMREDNLSKHSLLTPSRKQYNNFLDSILLHCTPGPTDSEYVSLITISQRTASPGVFVRPHKRPPLYRLFGSSRDDSHPIASIFESINRITTCSRGFDIYNTYQAYRA